MIDLLRVFGTLFLWALLSCLACLVCTAVFAAAWIPLANLLFRFNDWCAKK